MDKQIMTVDEAANYIRCSRGKLYELCRKNEIPHYKIGNRKRFLKSLLDEWMAKQNKK